MGKRGPLPKKKYAKVMTGKLPLTKENGSVEDVLPTDPPEAPEHLSKKELKVWNKTIKLLAPSCVLSTIDGGVLAAYCCSYVRWMEAESEIESLTSFGANGQIVVNPLVNISRRAQADMVAYANQMGMTPSARMRVDLKSPEETKNPFAKLKQKKKNGAVVKKSSRVRKVRKPQKK